MFHLCLRDVISYFWFIDRMYSKKKCLVYDLGIMDYLDALDIQNKLVDMRVSSKISDMLVLLEHPPVFTIGRSGEIDSVVAPNKVRQNTPVLYTNRGGGITYHGPGQLICYPIFNLRENELSVHKYISNLEEVVIKSLACLGVTGKRKEGYPGVWVNEEKICSLGLRITRGVSMHGFALNVNTDLKYFTYILPCGMSDKVITSVSKLIRQKIDMRMVKKYVLQSFTYVFGIELKESDDNLCLII